jgi:ribonuclease HI
MEIMGLIAALNLATTIYKEEKCIIYCDSAYCVNMFNS